MNKLLKKIKHSLKIKNWKLKIKRSKYAWLILSSLFVILGITVLTIYLQTNHSVEAAWYNTNWSYRQPFTITNSSGGTLTNIQKGIQINTSTLVTAGKLQSNCNDLRFTDTSGNVLSYYIDSGCNTTKTNIWIIIPNLINSTSTFYMYYGNPSAPQGSTTTGFDNVIGLQGYWNMNEGSGSTAFDSSPNGNNGAVTGTTIVSGEVGNARSFNGSSETINLGNDASLEFPGDFTLAAWVYENAAGTGEVIQRGSQAFGGVAPGTDYEFGFVSGTLYFEMHAANGVGVIAGVSGISAGSWHYITAVFRASTSITIYVDGVQGTTSATTGDHTQTATGVARIGSGPSEYFFNGKIDDVKVYSNARSASQVLSDYQNPARYTIASAASVPSYSFGTEQVGPGPVAYWKFDEGTGTTAHDSTGGNNYAATNATWQSGESCYNENTCVSFDGASNYIATSVDVKPSTLPSTTWSAWILPTQTSSTRQEIISSDDGGFDRSVLIEANTTNFGVFTGSGVWQPVAISMNQWQYIAVTYTPTNIYFYKNGVQYTFGSAPTTDSTANLLNIGRNPAGVEYFQGAMNDIRIYNYALTTNQVQSEYASQSVTPGPIAFWQLSNGTGTTITDFSGNNSTATLHGTIYTGPTWQTPDQCISGNCLRLDGSSTYATIRNPVGLNYSSGGMTISFWAKRTPGGSNTGVVSKRVNGSAATNYSLFFNNNGTLGSYNGSTFVTTTKTVSLNQWHYIVALYSTSQIQYYVDGKFFETITQSIGATNTGNLYIGVDSPFSAEIFPGFIDDLKIYPYARTAAQVKADYNSRGSVNASANVLGASAQNNGTQTNNYYLQTGTVTSLGKGLVGWWKMDETSWNNTSGEVTDSSGNSNNGTGIGYSGLANPDGVFAKAGNFDGATQAVTIPHTSSLNLGAAGSSYTVSIWMLTPYSGFSGVFTKVASGQNFPFALNLNDCVSRKISFEVFVTSEGSTCQRSVTSNTTVNDGRWHQIVGVRSGGTLSLYVDGVLDNTASVIDQDYSNTTSVSLGRYISGSGFLPGSLDEARIYNRALSAGEIAELYSFGRNVVIPPVATYSFQEGSGTTVNDRSGYGNAAIWGGTGTSHWVKGKLDFAGNFNGTDDIVKIPNTTNIDHTNSLLSVSMFIKTKSSATSIPWSTWDGTGGNQIELFAGVVHTWSNGGGDLNSGVAINDGNWHHVETVWDGTTNYIYIDGKLITSAARSFSNATKDNQLGAQCSGAGSTTCTDFFQGQIDQVQIYNYAHTGEQVIQDMGLGASTVAIGGSRAGALAYWKFDEGYGTTANNAGNGGSTYNGTITGATWTNAGKFNKALHTTAVGNTIINLNFAQVSPGTVSLWFKPDSTLNSSSSNGILAQYASRELIEFNANSSGLTHDGKIYAAFYDGAWENISTKISTWNANQWYYIVYNWTSGGTGNLYVNGVLQSSISLGTVQHANNEFAINGDSNNGLANVTYDDVKVYSYVLTRQDMQMEYNHNSGTSIGSFGTAPDGKTGSNSASALYCVPGDTSTCAPPVGEWNFEQRGSSTVQDTSGNGNTGTWNGTGKNHYVTPGHMGWAGNFNGTDDYVAVGSSGSLNMTSAVTLSSWINPVVTNAFEVIMQKQDGTSGQYYLRLNSSGQLDGGVWIGGAWHSLQGGTVKAGQWQHVVMTYNGSTIILYLNGINVASIGASGAITTTSGQMDIGAWTNGVGGANFDGKIDQSRIYNYARTPAQVAWDYNQGAPVGWWKFDECQGTTAYDKSGNGNNGTINIGAGGTQTAVGTCSDGNTANAWNNGTVGKFNSSLSFDGTDDYVSLGSPSSLQLTGVHSYSLWIKTTQVPSVTSMIIGRRNGDIAGDIGSDIELSLSGQAIFVTNNGSSSSESVTSTKLVNDGKWHMITGLYIPSTSMSIYIDGVLSGQNTTSIYSSLNATSLPFNIGSRNGGAYFFNGAIDDVRVYTYALTPLQIKLLYNGGSAVRFGPSSGIP